MLKPGVSTLIFIFCSMQVNGGTQLKVKIDFDLLFNQSDGQKVENVE